MTGVSLWVCSGKKTLGRQKRDERGPTREGDAIISKGGKGGGQVRHVVFDELGEVPSPAAKKKENPCKGEDEPKKRLKGREKESSPERAAIWTNAMFGYLECRRRPVTGQVLLPIRQWKRSDKKRNDLSKALQRSKKGEALPPGPVAWGQHKKSSPEENPGKTHGKKEESTPS